MPARTTDPTPAPTPVSVRRRRRARAHGSRRRGAGLVLLTVPVLLAASCLWAATGPGVRLEWPVSMVSDLGAGHCFAAGGRWICSPRAPAFNAGLVVSGVLLLLSTLLQASWPGPRRNPAGSSSTAAPWWAAALVSAGSGLVVLGLCPSDSRHAVHMLGAVLALPAAAGLLLVSAVRRETPAGRSGRRGVRAGCAAAALCATLVHLLPHWRVQGAAECFALVCLLTVLLSEALGLLRDAGAEAGPPEESGEEPGTGPPCGVRTGR